MPFLAYHLINRDETLCIEKHLELSTTTEVKHFTTLGLALYTGNDLLKTKTSRLSTRVKPARRRKQKKIDQVRSRELQYPEYEVTVSATKIKNKKQKVSIRLWQNRDRSLAFYDATVVNKG